MSKVQLIGDEIWFDGHLLGLVAEGAPATVDAAFRDSLDQGVFLEDDDILQIADEIRDEIAEQESSPVQAAEDSDYGRALDDFFRSTAPFAKGGFIRLSDVAKIIAQLKEDEENDQ